VLAFLIAGFICIFLACSVIGWLTWRLRLRNQLLLKILNLADALEQQLYECRKRLQEIPPLMASLSVAPLLTTPPVSNVEPKVQEALRDLLAHRLWIKERASNATLSELQLAYGALHKSHAALTKQLDHLAEVRRELESCH